MRVLKVLLLLALLGGGLVAGATVAIRAGWISTPTEWIPGAEMIQARPEVRLATVSVESGRSADATVVATGYLESRRQAKIGARAPGRIEVVHVEEGIRVEPNQVLAVLEHADLDASLMAAKATAERARAELGEQDILIESAQREFARAKQLRASNSIADQEYDEKQFAYEGAVARRRTLAAAVSLAEARVREAEQMLENMHIRAPFSGTVISKDAEVGESILPGGMGEASGRGSVVTVADLQHLEVDCDVKEDYIGRIQPGQLAEVVVDAASDHRYQGRVRKIIPMGNRARATIKVKVEIIDVDERLFPEMSATVYFLPQETEQAPVDEKPRVFCESAALLADSTGSYVWVVDEESRLQRLDVTIGDERDGRTEVIKGLTGQEQVVVAPSNVRRGQLVRLMP